MRIWLTCNKLGVQFCDNILKPLESLDFCKVKWWPDRAGEKAADRAGIGSTRGSLTNCSILLKNMKFDQDDHVRMIELFELQNEELLMHSFELINACRCISNWKKEISVGFSLVFLIFLGVPPSYHHWDVQKTTELSKYMIRITSSQPQYTSTNPRYINVLVGSSK